MIPRSKKTKIKKLKIRAKKYFDNDKLRNNILKKIETLEKSK